jgi:hypothetical protein
MTDCEEVSTGPVNRSATELSAVAGRIGQPLSEFSASLSGTDGAFGTDEVSGPFAREYQPLVNQAMTAIASYQQQIEYASRGLTAMTEALTRSEQLGAADLARLPPSWRTAPPSP